MWYFFKRYSQTWDVHGYVGDNAGIGMGADVHVGVVVSVCVTLHDSPLTRTHIFTMTMMVCVSNTMVHR